MRKRNFTVEIFSECFQVDVGSVDMIVDIVKSFAGNVTVGNHHGFQAERLGRFANMDDVVRPKLSARYR